jgi:hypothetical protein
MIGCNAFHAFLLTYLLSYKTLWEALRAFLIKVSGSQGVPPMMAFTQKSSGTQLFGCSSGERYVTLPSLTQSARDFAIRISKPRQSPT